MLAQGLLIPSAADTEFAQLEEKILLHNKAFGDLPEDRRRFVVYYLLEYPKKGMREVAERSGLSKSSCYELAQDPGLMAMMISAAQVISGLGDLRCSIALDMLAEEMCARIAQGLLKSNDITQTMLRILEAGKTRLGLNPAAMTVLKASMTNKDGSRTEVSVAHLDNADSILSELKRRQERTVSLDFEAELSEAVQIQSPRGNETGICVQNRENGAKIAANCAVVEVIPDNSPSCTVDRSLENDALPPVNDLHDIAKQADSANL